MKKPIKPTIAFLTHDWAWGTEPLQPNGCAWYRSVLPSHELNKLGWKTTVGFPGFSNKNGFGLLIDNQRAIHGFDIIVFKLMMHQDILNAIPKAKQLGQKIVVDVDDWFDGLSKSNKAYDTTDPKLNATSNREIYKRIILSADAVITSTPFLFDYYSKLRDNVFMVRNGIDLSRWKPNKIDKNRKTTIGWVGATHWRSNDLEQLSSFFGPFIQFRNLSFHHSGHNDSAPSANSLLGVPDAHSRKSTMVPILAYPNLFKPIHIGIIPLNNIEFNHAKSFIKGLEYAAAGIPFVASYSPEYKYLADMGIGNIATTDSEWIAALDKLIDYSTRQHEIDKNLSALQNFSMSARAADWDTTFKQILNQK